MSSAILVQLVLLGAIWGASFLFQRVTVPVIGFGMTAAVRMLLAAITMWLLLKLLGKPLEWARRWRDFLIVGITASGLPFLCFAFGAGHLPAGYLGVLNATTPLFTVLLGWLAGARPSLSKLVGVFVGVAGVFVLAKFGSVDFSFSTALAFGVVLIAAISYATSARAAKARFPGVDPLVVAGGNMIGGALPLVPLAAFSVPAQWPPLNVVLALLALGVVCTAFAFVLFYRILAAVGSERTVTVTFLIPIFALLWGALFDNTPITWAMAGGCALVLCAVALIFELVPGFARTSAPAASTAE
jgi:drug/metabolite transporter (DMT)-like permease